MKKKKSSALLIGIAVVMAGVAIVFNSGSLPRIVEALRPKPPAAPPVQTPSAGDASSELQEAERSRGGPRVPPGMEAEMVNGVPTEPTIFIPEPQIFKPQVNDSTISSQWYDENSRQRAMTEKELAERQKAAGG